MHDCVHAQLRCVIYKLDVSDAMSCYKTIIASKAPNNQIPSKLTVLLAKQQASAAFVQTW